MHSALSQHISLCSFLFLLFFTDLMQISRYFFSRCWYDAEAFVPTAVISHASACVGPGDFYGPSLVVSRGCFHSGPGHFYRRSSPPVCHALVYCCMPSLIFLPLERRKNSDIWKRLVGKAISDHSVPADHTQLTGESETLALFEPVTSLQLKWRSLGYFSPLVLSSALMGERRARAPPARDIRRLRRRLRVMGLS